MALDSLGNQGFCQLWKFHEELAACRKDIGKINYKKEAYEGGMTLLSIMERNSCCVSTLCYEGYFWLNNIGMDKVFRAYFLHA